MKLDLVEIAVIMATADLCMTHSDMKYNDLIIETEEMEEWKPEYQSEFDRYYDIRYSQLGELDG
jgi:hypothetical protein